MHDMKTRCLKAKPQVSEIEKLISKESEARAHIRSLSLWI